VEQLKDIPQPLVVLLEVLLAKDPVPDAGRTLEGDANGNTKIAFAASVLL
jgi:hypothetical protein